MEYRMTRKVVETIADANGVDPLDLNYALGDYVDCDALEALARHPGTAWTFSFEVPEHTVTVTSGGTVHVGDRSGRRADHPVDAGAE